MFLWDRTDWTEFYGNADVRRGLRVRYEHGIDTDLKESIKRFILWIRRNYYFPFRVVIYIKSSEFITAKDGDLVSGTCFLPYNLQKDNRKSVALLFLLLYQIPPPKESVLTRIFKKVLSNTSFKPFVLRKFRCKRLSAYLYRFCNSRLFLPLKAFPDKKGKSVGSSPLRVRLIFKQLFQARKNAPRCFR